METKSPRFSVLIPSYNRPHYLSLSIKSVLNNGPQDFEVIVSDDNSPQRDAIKRLSEAFGDDRRVRFFNQATTLGWSRNRNFLVSQARGEFVMLIGDDDLLFPYTLERLAAHIASDAAPDLFGFGYEVIDENGARRFARRSTRLVTIAEDHPFLVRELLVCQVLPFWLFHPFTLCYRREIGSQIQYSEFAFIGDDLLFLQDCMRAGKRIKILPEALFQWRKLRQSIGAGIQPNLSSAANGIRARLRILNHLQTDPSWQSFLAKHFTPNEFVERFLYDSIRADLQFTEEFLTQIAITEPGLHQLLSGFRRAWAPADWLRIHLRLIVTYLRVCGLKGLPMICNYTGQFLQERRA